MVGCFAVLVVGCTQRPDPDGVVLPRSPHSKPAAQRSSSSIRPSAGRSSVPSRIGPASQAKVNSIYSRLDEQQRVAQLFMAGTPANYLDDGTSDLVRRGLLGSVILTGRSEAGVKTTAQLTAALQSEARTGQATPGLFIAVDQEGGKVQVLRGAGFDTMPSALQQGGIPASDLRTDAARWGAELKAAGVNLDLGPVLDTVADRTDPHSNGPIGHFDREYGFDPTTVSTHGSAVIAGLAAAGVWSTAKHFPGLGRVALNPDYNRGVRDTQTSSADPFLQPFRDAINLGVPFVMISTAIYAQIDDSGPAAFSPLVVTELLRHQLGFTGVVISDDLGNAAQVQGYSLADRVLDFLDAGGDMVLTVDSSQVLPMQAAVLDRMNTDPSFAAKVLAAVKQVLQAKLTYGLQ